MKDYFDNPDGTASAIDAEGWLHTGDLGSMDRHGYCRVQGRLKDLIIRGGENIYPREIEDLVFTHPAVANAAVVGVPDREWGEVAVAFVQIKAEAAADKAELNAFCRAKLASYKVPRIWRFVDQVSASEGLANHAVPESCADVREGIGEALTGVRIGWVLSRENNTLGDH